MPTPSVAQVIQDPAFNGLPLDQRRQVLVRLDPNFAALPEMEQYRTIGLASQKYAKSLLPAPRSAGKRFLSSAVAPIKGAAKAMLDARPTPQEQREGLTSGYDFWMRPFERVVEAQTGQVDEARDLAKQGRYSEAAGHAVASAVPMLGPWVADAAQQYYGQLGSGDTAGALGTAAGNTAMAFAPEAAGKVKELAPRVASAAGDLAMRPVRAVTGTGPRALRDVVKETTKAREAVDRANAQLATDRAADVRSHFDKTQTAKVAAEERSGVASRKAALESGVRKLSDRFQTDLKATRDKAAAEADAKYVALDKALGELPANGEFLPNALIDASEKIKGSETEPTIFRDIEKKIERGNGFSYSDLQGYYSELGRELKRGTLPGDVYTAYNSLQDSIGNEMQRIADSRGMGPQLADARTSWRNLKQTFYDPRSPLRKALNSTEAGDAVRELLGNDRTAIEALARYNPELARRGNVLRSYHEEASATRVPAASTKPAPQLAPRKAPVPYPEIGPREIEEAKAASLQKRSGRIQALAYGSAVWPLFQAIREVMSGNLPSISTVSEIGGSAALGYGIGRMLEKPAVVDFLTKATPQDVAAIPADLRGDFPTIARRAQAQGIKLSPALRLAFVGTAALGPRKPEQNPTDAWQGIGQQ